MNWPSLQDVSEYAKNQMIYMFGRGVIALPIAFGVTTGTGLMFAAFAVAATTVLRGYLTYRDEKAGSERLIHLYRDEIATKVGVRPSAVTLGHLNEVAYGNSKKDIEPNRVLAEAMERNSQKHKMQFATTGIAALMTFGGFWLFPGAVGDLLNEAKELFGSYASVAVPAAAMFASGWVMGPINKLLDLGVGEYLGLNRKTTSERIQDIKRELSNDKDVTVERVFGIYVSADRVLQQGIEEHYGKDYFRLSEEEQTDALVRFGHYYPIPQVTEDLNNYLVQADELAFIAVGQSSGIEKLTETPQRVVERRARAQEKEVEKEKLKEEPLLDRLKHSASRIVDEGKGALRDAHDHALEEGQAFTQRVMAERGGVIEDLPSSHVERLLKSQSVALSAETER